MLFALVAYPILYFRTNSHKDKIANYTRELRISTEKTQELEDAERILIKEGKLENLSKRLLTEDTTVDFIELIESVATSTNVDLEIRSVSTSNLSEDEKGARILTLDIKANGSWYNTMTLLHSLEKLPYNISLGRTSLRYKESSGQGESIVVSSWELLSVFSVVMSS